MATGIRARIKREREILKDVLKKKKLSYAIVFAVPILGLAASALWIAWDYFWKKNNSRE